MKTTILNPEHTQEHPPLKMRIVVLRHGETNNATIDADRTVKPQSLQNIRRESRERLHIIKELGFATVETNKKTLHSGLHRSQISTAHFADPDAMETAAEGFLPAEIHEDQRLRFDYESHDGFSKRFNVHYKGEKPDIDRFLAYESDQLVIDLYIHAKSDEEKAQIKKLTGFSTMAGNMAEVLQELIEELPDLKKKHEPKNTDSEKTTTLIQKFVGSHSINIESFIMALIKIKSGQVNLRNFFDEVFLNGFIDFHKGFEIDVEEKDGEYILKFGFNYLNKDKQPRFGVFDITKKDLEKIIASKQSFENKLAKGDEIRGFIREGKLDEDYRFSIEVEPKQTLTRDLLGKQVIVVTHEEFEATGGLNIVLPSGSECTLDPDDYSQDQALVIYPWELGNLKAYILKKLRKLLTN